MQPRINNVKSRSPFCPAGPAGAFVIGAQGACCARLAAPTAQRGRGGGDSGQQQQYRRQPQDGGGPVKPRPVAHELAVGATM